MAAAGTVSGAEQGTLGATSTGSLDVSVAIADRVQISGLGDIELGDYGGEGALDGEDAFCIYRNGTGAYQVTITSVDPDGTAFVMRSATESLGYSVTFDGTLVTSGQTISGTGNSVSPVCGGGTNTTLRVDVAEAALQGASSGTYEDTITMLVAPE